MQQSLIKQLKITTLINNTKGQMAIFVALIFQVLFVLFAMAINVGLVVHDKINLQNSVDLAAYFAASRQAEWLSVIGHQNYQIRQSWKLLTYRYRVLGSLGLITHPAHGTNNGITEARYAASDNPTVCTTFQPTWYQAPVDDDFCQTPFFQVSPPPQTLMNIAGFNPINARLSEITKDFASAFQEKCSGQGGANWLYATQMVTAFRFDQQNRIRTIMAEVQNLSQNNFYTLNGSPVKDGTYKTFEKNLTATNRASIGKFELLNSLNLNCGNGPCAGQMLNINKVAPKVYYSDQLPGDACPSKPKSIVEFPIRTESQNWLQQFGPETDTLKIYATQREPQESDDFHNSIGVEKNPWIMAYMGVYAETKPRQVFSPFGGVTMRARAFAKPFGGKIGPWMYTRWARGNDMSEGGDLVDPVGPMRANRLLSLGDNPNYSRFPRDILGMKSKAALNALKNNYNPGLSLDHYRQISHEFKDGEPNDILSWDNTNNLEPSSRKYEIASIAPNLFDVMYYSIMPFYENVHKKLLSLKGKINYIAPLRGDLGSRGANMTNISKHIETANSLKLPHINNFIIDKSHLMTAWVPKEFSDYSFPTNYFAKCAKFDDSFSNPNVNDLNGCVRGGRSGYSVKLVSKNYLQDEKLELGGSGVFGPISNPPSNSQTGSF